MRLAGLIALVVVSLHADVTLRYKSEVKMNSSLPPAIAQQATAGMTNGAMPTDITMLLKNGKGSSSAGVATSIVDFTKQTITMLDKDGKRYATLPANDLADQMAAAMPAMPDQAKAIMATMKSHFTSKASGATATIAGMESEERQMELTIDAPAMANVPEGPMMKMVMHIWTAKKSEVMKNPAVRELAGYNLYAYATMNPVTMLQKMFAQMPGFGDAFTGLMKEMQGSGTAVVTRMQVEMFMPMIAAMAKQNPQMAAMLGGFDGESPLMTMTQDVAELSTAAVPDAAFQIPEGYKEAPAADVVKAMFAKAEAAGKAAAAAAPKQ
jgi:hypothetical protein